MDDALLLRLAEVVASDDPRMTRARAVADLIRAATQARWDGVYTVDGGMVTNEAWSGPAAPAHPTFPVTRGLAAHAVRTRSIAVSYAVTRDPRYLTNQDDQGSELIVPVLDVDRVVGTLDVESGRIGAFGGEETARFERLARAIQPLWPPARTSTTGTLRQITAGTADARYCASPPEPTVTGFGARG